MRSQPDHNLSATARQLIQIRQLEQSLKEQGSIFNWPISLAITTTLMPFLFNLLSSYGLNPFSARHTSEYLAGYQKLLSLHSNITSLQKSLGETLDSSSNFIAAQNNLLKFLPELPPELSAAPLFSVKKNILRAINSLISWKKPGTIDTPLSDEPLLDETTISTLENLAVLAEKTTNTEELNKIIKITKGISNQALHSSESIITSGQAEITNTQQGPNLAFYNIIAFFTNYLLSSLFNRIIPYGVWQDFTKRNNVELLNQNEAETYIHTLSATKNKRQKYARWTNYLTIGGLLSFYSYSIYLTATTRLETAGTGWLDLSMYSTLFKVLIRVINKQYNQYFLPRAIKDQQNILQDIFSSIIPRHQLRNCFERLEQEDLQQSYLAVEFPRTIANIKSSIWAKTLRMIFRRYPVKIGQHGLTSIYLNANFKLSPQQIENIKNDILIARTRLEQIERLKNQFLRISSHTSTNEGFAYHLEFDNNGLPLGAWEGWVIPEHAEEFRKLLSSNFTVTQEQADNKVYFNIKGTEPFPIETFNRFLAKTNAYWNRERASILSTAQQETHTTRRRPITVRESTATQVQEDNSRTPTRTQQEPTMIRWGNHVYNSSDPTCPIVPINNLHAPAMRQFGIWKLSPSDFRSREEHDYFKRIATEHPTIVAAQGRQGIKRTSELTPFGISTYKIKALGLFGNTRVFGKATTNETGHTVVEYCYVSTKHA